MTFAAYIPLYASCNPTLIGDTDVSAVPIRMLHGAADDYVPVAPCRAYVERLQAAGRRRAAHRISPTRTTPTTIRSAADTDRRRHAQSVRACNLKEEPLGTIINTATSQPFSYADPCVQTGPHIGYNEAAALATQVAVKDLLRTVFKLN